MLRVLARTAGALALAALVYAMGWLHAKGALCV